MTHRTFFKADLPTRYDTKRQKELAEAAAWKSVCAIVDARDGRQCRACDKRSDPNATGTLARGHRHHLVYRSAGGKDTADNLVLLCAGCHNDEHQHRLRIDGVANGPLMFWRKDDTGQWFVSREEIAVRVVRKD